MYDPLDRGLFDIPDYEQIEDEAFPPLPPPHSPGQAAAEEQDPFGNEGEDGEVSKLAEVPAAKRSGVKRPQPKLDSQRLISERGLPALRTLFNNVRFKGKGHEAEDLRLLMHKMENWAHRLYPKLQFEDFIQKVEKLGAKKEVQTCLKRIRLDLPLTHDDFISKDGEEDAAPAQHILEEPDPFASEGFPDDQGPIHSTPAPTRAPPTPAAPILTEEQQRRIELNKQLALERRLARKQQQHADLAVSQNTSPAVEPTAGSSSQTPPQQDDQDQDQPPARSSSSSSAELHHKAPPEDSPPPPDSPDGVNPEVSPSSPQTTSSIQDDD